MTEMDGVIVIDKPQGWTSHDVVNFVRKKSGIRKVGHAGTLDPMATGVLVVLPGKSTKLSQEYSQHDKRYLTRMILGVTTDTQDAEGRIIKTQPVSGITDKKIEEALKEFKGEIEQVPPMVSAIKHKGQPLYKLARKGISIARKPRQIFVEELKLTSYKMPEVTLDITCSKGTYVRTLCDDIGNRLGCGGHMSYLRRVRSGKFGIEEAVTVEDLKNRDIPRT